MAIPALPQLLSVVVCGCLLGTSALGVSTAWLRPPFDISREIRSFQRNLAKLRWKNVPGLRLSTLDHHAIWQEVLSIHVASRIQTETNVKLWLPPEETSAASFKPTVQGWSIERTTEKHPSWDSIRVSPFSYRIASVRVRVTSFILRARSKYCGYVETWDVTYECRGVSRNIACAAIERHAGLGERPGTSFDRLG